MPEPVKRTNPAVRYGILIVVIGVFLWSYIQEKKPQVKTGEMEYRMVTGTKAGNFQVILIETSDRYVILDADYREILVAEDGELISRAKQLRLLEQYKDIEYRVGANEKTPGLKPGYRVTREIFNQLRFGEPVKYEVSKKQPDRILSIK
ncbi:MAG: hypothetical protein PHY99_08585 [Bacteroidales bacterium]|nr:hypothetical protein [Bacteroidales bacterium]